MLLLLFVIQFFIRGSLYSLRWENDFIFYMLVGAALALIKFEKPPLTWEQYWKKNK